MSAKDKGTDKRKERKLTLLPGGKVESESQHPPTTADHGPIVVPRVGADGAPLPAWRLARWHLVNAATLLFGEYRRERGEGRSLDFARAGAVTMQTYASLEPEHPRNSDPTDGDRLRKMARESRYRLKTDKSDAERWLLEKLPATAKEAQETDYWKAMGAEAGAKNLATIALTCLAAQDHADAAKVLRRWRVQGSTSTLGSPRFWEDVDTLASEIHELLDPSETRGGSFARALVGRMYRLLRLGPPFEADKKKRRRGKRES